MRIAYWWLGAATFIFVVGSGCGGSSNQPNGGSAGMQPSGGSSNASAGASDQSGGSPTAGTGGSAASGGASSGGSAGSSQAGSAGEAGAAGLPANLDPTVCASVVYDDLSPDASTQRAACNQCCNQGQFSSFGSYMGTCMCGTLVPANTTVCPSSSDAACKTCCTSAGYPLSIFNSPTCYCYGDSTDCASAKGDGHACLNCCTEHGYLAWSSTPDGCTCTQ
jgi:hypothetical protein